MSQRLAVRTAVVASTLATTATLAVLPAATAVPAPAPMPGVAPVAQIVPATPAAAPAAAAPAVVAPAAVAPAVAVRSGALQNALGKLGSPYRWGASGPHAFDCSGLVNWAFRQEGVALPRTSRALASVGTPVAKSDLRPGDLVLFYRPVSHVGIYVGDGRIVHASTSGSPVKISDVDAMPFHSARRV